MIGQFAAIEPCWIRNGEWNQPGAPSRFRQTKALFSNPEALRRIAACSEAFRADVWMAHNIYPIISPALYPFAAERGIPILQYVHNYRPFSVSGYLWAANRVARQSVAGNYWPEIFAGAWQESVPRTLLLAAALWHARRRGWFDHVSAWIVLSRYMRDLFLEGGIPKSKLHLIPHPWEFTPDASATSDDGHYLFLTNLVAAKGIRTVIAAWNILARFPGCPRLVIAGGGPLETEAVAAAEANPSVDFRGWISDREKADALRRCRAVLVPSLWPEPLPTVIFEAFNYSKPVIGSAIGGILDLVTPGEDGFLFPPGNANSLVEQVSRCEAATPAERAGLGHNGRQRLVRRHDVATWRARFESCVEQARRSAPGLSLNSPKSI